ncbi:hypothetical protein Hanom_Chr16g01465331 [Helianthus anomalus]
MATYKVVTFSRNAAETFLSNIFFLTINFLRQQYMYNIAHSLCSSYCTTTTDVLSQWRTYAVNRGSTGYPSIPSP